MSEIRVDNITDEAGTGSPAFPNGLGPRSIQVFQSSGTWTKPPGVNFIKVTVTGGGAGGAGIRAFTDDGGEDNDCPGIAGASGGTAIKIIDVTSISSVSVTVGSGGTGKNGDNDSNNPGGTSSFGSFCSATGGQQSFEANSDFRETGPGGNGSGGDINIPGSSAGMGNGFQFANENLLTGAPSFWGGGAASGAHNSSILLSELSGSLGGGGAVKAIQDGDGGLAGDGGDGIVVVEEFV